MATRGAALPVERGYLQKAWFAVLAVLLVAGTAIALSFALSGNDPAGGTGIEPMKDLGPVEMENGPIVVNGEVCGQCR
jgi:hypothetical protein